MIGALKPDLPDAMQHDLRPGTTFARLAIAKAIGRSMPEALNVATARWGAGAGVVHVLRAAVAGGFSTDADFSGLADARLVALEFVEAARPMTILGKLQGLRRVPVNVPVCVTSTGATAFWVGESKGVPLSRQAFDRTAMRALKAAALAVFSNELLQDLSPEAEDLIRRDLIAAAAELMDRAFIGEGAGTAGVTPAAINAGLTPIASSGVIGDDIAAAIEAFQGDLATAAWVMHPRTAVQIGLKAAGGIGANLGARGGELGGLPAVVSSSCVLDSSGATITLLDAAGVAFVDEGADVALSSVAKVEMSDAPAGATDTPTSASAVPVSLFQSDSSALLVTRRVNWLAARAGSVVTIADADYAGS